MKKWLKNKNSNLLFTINKKHICCIIVFILILLFNFIPAKSYSQQTTDNEIQVNMNTYFDNYYLTVYYPSINVTKSIDKNTSINASYLVDAITSASMKMLMRVDGVASATHNATGGADNTPDELRHQLSLGFTRNISEITFNALGMYSIEHDYSSKTFASNLSIPFAKKNTTLLLGYAGNWDKVFPQTRFWTRDRNTTTINLGLSQILSKTLIAQADFSFINISGYMLDGYQVVRIINGPTFMNLEPVEPDKWVRKSAGLRTNIALSKLSTLQLGYRYYWDTWDIKSHTVEATYKTHLSDVVNMTLDLRQYFQTKAYFFKSEYTQVEPLMGVDSKLNSGYTTDASVGFTFQGNKNLDFPIINNDNVALMTSLGIYHRHTDSVDWIMRMADLYAILINIGVKISF
jgi:hypothetical protein